MFEIKVVVNIEASELAGAVTRLADAMLGGKAFTGDNVQPPAAGSPGAGILPAPVHAAPVPAPIPSPAPAPVPVPAAPAPAPIPAAPVPASAPSPVPAASVTMEAIQQAGAGLINANAAMRQGLMELLRKYGVGAVSQLAPGQYDAFAADLRALGANI